LAEALDDLEPDNRIASFIGATPLERREELKRRFNSDPAEDPLRILICTDAAREGINLQMRCHDLIHIDLPWNPARLEQRNGTANYSHRRKSGAAISSMSSARKMLSSRRWCGKRSLSARTRRTQQVRSAESD
jgi:superfamily II DNA/RNA helicase